MGTVACGLFMITVLSVDNWLPLPDIICRFLERKEDILVEASLSVKEALQKMDHQFFDVIVTDYNFKESADIDLLREPDKGVL